MGNATPDTMAAADRPIFVLGERAPAVQLVQALADTEGLCALPVSRLLRDLVDAADGYYAAVGPVAGPDLVRSSIAPARWYGEFQAAHRRVSGAWRTVEFSGLSLLRLCALFPGAQFVVVRRIRRAMPPSRRPPVQEKERILEIDSAAAGSRETLGRVLNFLGEPVRFELDLSDTALPSATPLG
jgi:hypothetical protein